MNGSSQERDMASSTASTIMQETSITMGISRPMFCCKRRLSLGPPLIKCGVSASCASIASYTASELSALAITRIRR